jgi:hypothetical protein
MQGENSFQDVELEVWKVELDIDVVKKEMCELKIKKKLSTHKFKRWIMGEEYCSNLNHFFTQMHI